MKRIVLALVFSIFTTSAVSQSGCYGSFSLTRKLHSWNGTLGNQWVNWLVFLGLVILPVYGITLIVDGFILNSVEFWTGDNPVGYSYNDDGSVKVVSGDQELLLRGNDSGDIEVLRDGELVGYAKLSDDGSLTLTDVNGEVIEQHSAEDIESKKAAAQSRIVPSAPAR